MRPPSRIGDYELTGRLGEGGAGSVFLARHPQLGYEVAIKVPLGGVTTSDRHRERFAREADALAKLRHPGLVDVVDRGLERGQPWFAMRRVRGRDLSECLEDRVLREAEAFDLASQLADALGAAHAVGVLHRDLKPDNVIRTTEGRYVVTDFGLAKDLEVERSVELSKTGHASGTPGFWAPEQATGQPTSPATDVYGIGATVYAALTGEPPIEADSFLEAVLAAKQQKPKSLSGHGIKAPRLEPILRRCLEKDPAARYPDLASLRDALDLASLSSVHSGPSPVLIGAVLSLALVGGSALTGVLLFEDEGLDPGAEPTREVATLSPSAGPSASESPLPSPPPTASPSPAAPSPRSEATAPELAAEGRRLLEEGETNLGLAKLNEAWIRGDLQSGMLLAEIYHEGRGVLPDRVVARDLYRRAADRGHGPAMIALGRSLHRRSPKEARAWFRQALEAGETAAAYLGLADVARLRAESERDLARARGLYEQAGKAGAGADAGYGLALTIMNRDRDEGTRILRAVTLEARHEKARVALAGLLAGSSDPEERHESVRLLQEGADAGQGTCWAQLGVLCQRGNEFVDKDPDKALRCFANAVKLGAVEGLISMARVFPNDPKGLEFLERAVALEEPRAQLELGRRRIKAGKIQEGVALIQEAGKAQHPQALGLLAEFYEQGRYVKANLSRSDDLLERAARAGDPTASHNLGLQYRFGKRRPKDLGMAELCFERAAAQGLVVSFNHCADLLLQRGETEGGLTWLRRGVERKDPSCMLSLGNELVAGKLVERDLPRALALFVAGAELGNSGCAHMGAMMMERGLGTEGKKKDWAGAAGLYERAAKAGDASSMLALAEILATGRGVKKDVEASEAWYQRAIDEGNPRGEALFLRGSYYAKAEGLPHRPRMAADLFRRAAAVGHREAKFQYAIHLCKGEAIPKDFAAGVELFKELVEVRHHAAALNLGQCYAHGTSVPKDVAKARELFEFAARVPDDEGLAKAARAELAKLDKALEDEGDR
jgi:eukaryotic-like serine/threonine-protein kinase